MEAKLIRLVFEHRGTGMGGIQAGCVWGRPGIQSEFWSGLQYESISRKKRNKGKVDILVFPVVMKFIQQKQVKIERVWDKIIAHTIHRSRKSRQQRLEEVFATHPQSESRKRWMHVVIHFPVSTYTIQDFNQGMEPLIAWEVGGLLQCQIL